ncbi:uncharacterized protein METZ01_LOCUS340400, partial [marine metagenome]
MTCRRMNYLSIASRGLTHLIRIFIAKLAHLY